MRNSYRMKSLTTKLIRKELNGFVIDFSCVPLTPDRAEDRTTSCSSSASNTLYDKALNDKEKKSKVFHDAVCTFEIDADWLFVLLEENHNVPVFWLNV